MARRILLLTAGLAAACGGVIRSTPGSGKGALSYAQSQSLEAGMTAKTIVRLFGPPADILRQKERVRGLTYACENASGEVGELRMVFSAEERLEKWTLKPAGAPAGKQGG